MRLDALRDQVEAALRELRAMDPWDPEWDATFALYVRLIDEWRDEFIARINAR